MEISLHGNQTLIWFMTSMKIRKSFDCKCLRGVLRLQVKKTQENTCVGLLQAYSIKYFNFYKVFSSSKM